MRPVLRRFDLREIRWHQVAATEESTVRAEEKEEASTEDL